MDKKPMSSKWAMIIVVVVVVVVAVVWAFGNKQSGTGQPATNTSATGTSSTNPGGGSTANPPAKGVPTPSVNFITPVANQVWKIGNQNLISWFSAPGFSGQIDLLNPTTHALVGVILNEIGPHQTSYTWNTRDLLPSRTNPLKKTVLPGTYVVELQFDGNNVPTVISAPVTITN
jgi:hypothetical protein